MKPLFFIVCLIPSLALSNVRVSVICESPEAAETYFLESKTKPAWKRLWEMASAYTPLKSECSKGRFKAEDLKFLHYNIFKAEDTGLSKKFEVFKASLVNAQDGDDVFFFSPPCELEQNCADKLEWTRTGPLKVCKDFPQVLAHASPLEGFLGKAFEYRLRFSCDWTSRYKRKKLNGGFIQKGKLWSVVSAMRTEKLPSNEEVLVVPMYFPNESPFGDYIFDGCLEIEDTVYTETLCVKLFDVDIRVKKQTY